MNVGATPGRSQNREVVVDNAPDTLKVLFPVYVVRIFDPRHELDGP